MPAVGDVYEVVQTWHCGLASGDIANVLHYVVIASEQGKTDQDFASMLSTGLHNAWSAHLTPTYSNQLTFAHVAVVGLSTPTFRADFPFSTAGSNREQLTSIRAAPVVTKRSSVRGRRFNGRMFMPPVTEDSQANGSLTTGQLNAINSYLGVIKEISTSDTGTADLAVYSRAQSEAQGRIVATLVTTATTRAILGTIRGRRRVS